LKLRQTEETKVDLRKYQCVKLAPHPRPTPIGGFFKAAIKGAVIYGLSAASPPLGAVLIPAYTAYGYSKLGYGLLQIYREVSVEGKVSPDSMKEASESLGGVATQSSADSIASTITERANQSGLFKEMATKTGIQEVVIAEMMRGSASSALSTGGGELAKFAIMKVVGA